MLVHGQMGEKGGDMRLSRFPRVDFMMKQDKSLYPVGICLFGTDTVMAKPNGIADLIQQFLLLHARLPALFIHPFRLPIRNPNPCFFVKTVFYIF